MWKVIGRVALLITSRPPIQNATGGKGALPSAGPHLNAKDAFLPTPPHPHPSFFSFLLHPISSLNFVNPFFPSPTPFTLYGLIISSLPLICFRCSPSFISLSQYLVFPSDGSSASLALPLAFPCSDLIIRQNVEKNISIYTSISLHSHPCIPAFARRLFGTRELVNRRRRYTDGTCTWLS